MVPVLSKTTTSTAAVRSNACALRYSTPYCAPLPVAIVIDNGVARPNAHGHAITSTQIAQMMP